MVRVHYEKDTHTHKHTHRVRERERERERDDDDDVIRPWIVIDIVLINAGYIFSLIIPRGIYVMDYRSILCL